VPPVRVNVAVLSIADSTARGNVPIENIVADRLTESGHLISAFEAVRDNETAIRAQLTGWLADPDVDAVLVIGDGEHTSSALKPMVDQALPGFADLLRMLAYQEIGASAMLSTAEAVRCGTTFVFVVPGNEASVKAALEKLILPQFDPKTKPRNLIGSMPRLRDLVEHDVTKVDVGKLGEVPIDVTKTDNARIENARKLSAIPTPIPVEKTASGAGVSPKLPAGRAEAVPVQGNRPRSRTGVNVIVRDVEDPTKPIELQKLEEQIELSKDQDKTKVAPATESQQIPRANVATRPLDVGNLRAPATPNANARPLPSIVRPTPPVGVKSDDHTKVDHHTNPDTLTVGDLTKPLPLAQAIPPVEIRPRGSRPKVEADSTKPLDLDKLPKLPPGANQDVVDAPEPDQNPDENPDEKTGEVIALATKKDATAPVARIPLKTVVATMPIPKPALPKATPPAPTPVVPARVRQPTPPIPTSVVIPLKPKKPKPEEIVETLDIEPDAEPGDAPIVAPGEPAPAVVAAAPEPEPPVDDDPDVASSHLLDVRKARRSPTQPPPLSDLITNAPSSSLSDLPRGQFVYPTRRRSKVPLVIVLLLLSAGIGGGAMWFVNREKKQQAAEVTPPPADAAVAAVEIDAQEVAALEPDAAEPEIEMTPPDAAQVAAIDPRPNRPTRPTRPVDKPIDRPPVVPVDKPPGRPPVDKPVDKPGVVAEPGCEEVACVMEKYARACCARFKPQGETFVPSLGSGDNLSKMQIKAGVDKMKPRVIACGEEHAAKGKGTVKLSISVDPAGNVTDLSVTMAPDDALGTCIATALRKAKFASTKNGGSFTYPFVF
jgi:molybdopterin adenylyltransferase